MTKQGDTPKMEIDFIVLWKKKARKNADIKAEFLDVLHRCFDNVDEQYITINTDGDQERVEYKMSSGSSEQLYFKVVARYGTVMRSARVLDEFSSQLLCGGHRKEFNIITTYDEPSHTYCCKLMPLFGRFERRLREFIYLTVVKAFGVEWFEKSFNKEMKGLDELASLGEEKLIEGALNELTFSGMHTYLFEPYSMSDSAEVIADVLRNEGTLSKDEIIAHLSVAKQISLWDRLFSEYEDLSELSEELEFLRKKRNKVMHAKHFTRSEMEDTRKVLRKAESKLEHAIEVLDKKNYDDVAICSMINAFSALISSFSAYQERMQQYAERITSAMKPLQSTISEIIARDVFDTSAIGVELNALFDSPQLKELSRLGNLLTTTYATGKLTRIDNRRYEVTNKDKTIPNGRMSISIEEIPISGLPEFWEAHLRYLKEDGIVEDPEELEYFASEEYRGVLRDHMLRELDKQHMVYFVRDGVYIGVASYCTYQSEDGKCFILDYWVFPEYRGDGTGHRCFEALEAYTRADGALYYALNSEKEDSIRFWKSLGFVEDGVDEWGMKLFVRK